MSSSSSELLKAQTHVWNNTFSFVASMSLKCAVQLGIPDAVNSSVAGKPISFPDLLTALKIPQAKSPHLRRLLRVLVHSGFLIYSSSSDDDVGGGCYSLTAAGKLLLKDSPSNLRAFVEMVMDPVFVSSYHEMSTWLLSEEDDATPFYAAHQKGVYDHMGGQPKLKDVFNEAMAGDSRLIADVVVNEGKSLFEGVMSLVDVAGGTGTMAKAIATAFPEMTCTVLDRPHVVSGLVDRGNLKFVSGDMFQSIPSADVVLLKWILHNWSDKESVKILKNCKKAVMTSSNGGRSATAGKIIIIDMVVDHDNKNLDDDDEKTTHYNFDMQMMVNVGGKERNEEEFAKLFKEAGFGSYNIRPILGPRALIEVYP
ncbi:Trans-resveratrol di-O-methyltransferase [Linum grandiflorum]